MPLPSRTQLVLLEIAGAAVVVGIVYEGAWMIVGIAAAVVCVALAVVPVRRRSLYLVLRSWSAMRWRRRNLRGQGIASLVGGTYEVVTVPRGSGGVSVAAIRDGTTWSVPLALPLVGVFNDDPPIPLDSLATLLRVEDVPLSSVRVVCLLSPVSAASVPGAAAPISRLATRYLVLTLDTAYAADVIAARGGGPAVQQILRRCVLRAEAVLKAAGVPVRRVPAEVVAAHSSSLVGPVGTAPDGTAPPARERSDHVLMAGSMSTTFAVSGAGALAHLEQMAASLPVPVVATSVALQPGPAPRHEPTVRLLIRVTGPSEAVRASARLLGTGTRQHGLTLHRLVGDQVPLMRATTLLGVPAEAR